MIRISLAAAVLAACGGGGESPDAAVMIDAPLPNVVALTSCPAFVSATVMDSATAFIPKASTISVGGVVKFVLTSEHFLIPNTLVNTDPVLMAGRNQTKCFQFNAVGTWGFACGVHGFAGTITVQ